MQKQKWVNHDPPIVRLQKEHGRLVKTIEMLEKRKAEVEAELTNLTLLQPDNN